MKPLLKGGASDRQGLIFVREHDGEHTNGLGRISRILTPVHHIRGVVVDLPEDFLSIVIEGTEIMFAMRIVVLSEIVEITNGCKDNKLIFDRQGINALSFEDFRTNPGR